MSYWVNGLNYTGGTRFVDIAAASPASAPSAVWVVINGVSTQLVATPTLVTSNGVSFWRYSIASLPTPAAGTSIGVAVVSDGAVSQFLSFGTGGALTDVSLGGLTASSTHIALSDTSASRSLVLVAGTTGPETALDGANWSAAGVSSSQPGFNRAIGASGIVTQVYVPSVNPNPQGTAGNDTLNGSGGDNVLTGLGGDDTINGNAGNDILDGGEGNDTVSGGQGDDLLRGGAGNDALNGGDGTDTADYSAEAGGITVSLDTGVATGAGTDTLSNIENVTGGSGNDVITGNGSANRLIGGMGDDTFAGGAGNDVLDGGLGRDTAIYTGSVAVTANLATGTATQGGDTDTLISIENLIGGDGNDSLTGDDNANTLMGGDGNDTLAGGLGLDDLAGGEGDDIFTGSLAEIQGDQLNGGAGNDTLVLTTGGTAAFADASLKMVETITLSGATNIDLSAQTEGFTVNGSTGNDTIIGGQGANTLNGGQGNDTLIGGAAADRLNGGQGNDTLTGGAGDVAVFSGPRSNYTITVNANGTTTVRDNVGTDGTDTVSGITAFDFGGTLLDLNADIRLLDAEGVLLATFTSLQAAVNAAEAGQIIDLRAGTFVGDVIVDVDITIRGPNSQVAAGGARGAEAIIQGRIVVAADGVSLQGVQVAEGGQGGPFSPAGVHVQGDDFTAVNNVFTRSGPVDGDGYRGIVTVANVSGVTITGNSFSGWATGVYLNPNTTGQVQGNAFDGNFVGLSADNPVPGLTVSGNSFADSGFEDIGVGVFGGAEIDLDDTFGDNGGASPNTYVLNGGTAQGTAGNDSFIGAGGTVSYEDATGGVSIDLEAGTASGEGAGSDSLDGVTQVIGSDFADTITGSAGNDVITGGGGVDTVDGGAGFDTFVNIDATVDGLAFDTTQGWSLGDEFLTNFEAVVVDSGRVLLVGGDGFPSIQDAINAAQNGDTILIAPGTYTGDLTIPNGLSITLQGWADVDIQGQITTSGTLNGSLVFRNLNIDATGEQYGIYATNNSSGTGGIILDGVDISGASTNGFAYIRAGNGSTPTLADTLGFITIVDSEFANNGTVVGANGRGDVLAFGFNGFFNVRGSTFEGNDGQKAIQVRGVQNGSTYFPLGEVNLEDIEISGSYLQDAIAFYRFSTTAGFRTSDVVVEATAPWGAINLDQVGGTIDISGVISDGPIAGSVQGDAGANVFTGTLGDDVLRGRGGDDELDGGDGIDVAVYSDASGSVTVNLGENSASGAAGNDTLTNIENVIGSASGDSLTGDDFDNVLDGGAGNDTLAGGSGNDTLIGGTGTDTAVFNIELSAEDFTANGSSWTVGEDTLLGVEVVTDSSGARVLLVGSGGYATIQEAINAAQPGDTILIADGVYAENITIATDGISLVAAGDNVVIKGSFKSLNGIDEGTSVGDHLKTAVAYSGVGGAGVTVSADNVTLSGITIDDFLTGIELGEGVDGLSIVNVQIEDTVTGIRKGTAADITNLEIIGGEIRDTYIGINFAKSATLGDGLVTGVLIDGMTFRDLTEKGIYAEALSDAQLLNLVMVNVGQYGRGPAFGGTGANAGGFGAGIDINLKFGTYSNIVIRDFDFTDVGSSDRDGANAPHGFGGAITIKARDDGPAYASPPAVYEGEVVIDGGTISGTSTGVRVGEPGKAVGGPAVVVTDVDITGAVTAQVDNVSTATLRIELTDGADTLTVAPTSNGPISIDGGLGNDSLTGGNSAADTAVFTGNLAEYSIVEGPAGVFTVQGPDGTDTLSNIEFVQFADGTYGLAQAAGLQGLNVQAGEVWVVQTDGSTAVFSTVQAAVTAASAGAYVVIGDGTYAENVLIGADKDGIVLTSVNGPGAVAITGLSGAGRLGTVQLASGADNVTINGITVAGINGNGAIENAAVYLQGNNTGLTLTNNEIVANGDAGLMSEFGGAIVNAVIDGNIFSGQTFVGPNPGGIGFSTQFDVGNNVPRQLVVLGNGGGAGQSASNNVTFTNNQVTGTTGGLSAVDGATAQGNTLVTIDVSNSTISGNTFSGNAGPGTAAALRARRDGTDITDNLFDERGAGDFGTPVFVQNNTTGTISGNLFIGEDGVAYASDTAVLPDGFTTLVLTDVSSRTEDFENFTTGNITDGENGWRVLAVTDQGVVTDPNDGDNQVLRVSSDPSNAGFGGPYSPALSAPAGEGGQVNALQMTFTVRAVSPGDNSRLEVDLGNTAGNDRINFMVLENTADGLRLAVNEPQLDGNWTTNDFTAFTGNRTLVSGLDSSADHEITLVLRYEAGQDNDVIDVYVNGDFVGTTTTFENYRVALGQDHAASQAANTASRLFFRSGANGAPTDGPGGQNQGFYFDNIRYSSFNSRIDSEATGNGLDNVIEGNSQNNVLRGLDGNDQLFGNVGNDTLDGGAGNDTLEGGVGFDTFSFGTGFGDDVILDFGADDQLVFSVGSATVELDGENSVITTTEGTVTLVGYQMTQGELDGFFPTSSAKAVGPDVLPDVLPVEEVSAKSDEVVADVLPGLDQGKSVEIVADVLPDDAGSALKASDILPDVLPGNPDSPGGKAFDVAADVLPGETDLGGSGLGGGGLSGGGALAGGGQLSLMPLSLLDTDALTERQDWMMG